MAGAVLAAAGAWMERHLFAPMRQPGDPRQRLEGMSAALDTYYAGGRSACLLELFSSGEAARVFGPRVRRALATWIDTLASVFEDAGAPPAAAQSLAEDALIRIQGALVLSRGLGSPGPFSRLVQRLPAELLEACGRLHRREPAVSRDRPAQSGRRKR
jgi:hypothetical protein